VLFALQQLALAYLDRTVATTVPFWLMATASINDLSARAHEVVSATGVGDVVASEAVPGAGSAPGAIIPSVAIRVGGDHLAALRAVTPPVIARSRDGATLLDVRTVHPSDDAHLAAALAAL
jgi:L-seryl-tRNA(Ser) seleniumtransferase